MHGEESVVAASMMWKSAVVILVRRKLIISQKVQQIIWRVHVDCRKMSAMLLQCIHFFFFF